MDFIIGFLNLILSSIIILIIEVIILFIILLPFIIYDKVSHRTIIEKDENGKRIIKYTRKGVKIKEINRKNDNGK